MVPVRHRIFVLFTALLCLAAPAEVLSVMATRLVQQPLLGPGQFPWTEAGLFNPTAIKVGTQTILLFRAQDRKGTSRVGYAASSDGMHSQIRPEPVLSPDAEYEKNGGADDPRVVAIGSAYYLTYTGYDGHSAQLCLAVSQDLIHWQRKGVIMPAYKGGMEHAMDQIWHHRSTEDQWQMVDVLPGDAHGP
jgi:predicted GH43/DUF377 family glycosyl hydrolase